MNKWIFLLLFSLLLTTPQSQCVWAKDSGKVKINASELKNAAEIIRRNQTVFKDPEMMKRYANLIKALKNK